MSVLIIQKHMIVQQQAQLNNIFQSQRDGILIYSIENNDLNIEMSNEAFNRLVNVNCLAFKEDPSTDSHFDDNQFVLKEKKVVNEKEEDNLEFSFDNDAGDNSHSIRQILTSTRLFENSS